MTNIKNFSQQTQSSQVQKYQLEHQKGSFKVIIPEKVWDKIQEANQIIYEVEWSGTLFYRAEGSFDDGSFVATLLDFYPQDIGSSAYTEFRESPDKVGYMIDEGLFDAQEGLIHSHNNMNAFFSGTDVETLREQGSDMGHFLSVIVNNAGDVVARVTRKVEYLQQINESLSYSTYGGKNHNLKNIQREVIGTKIQWWDVEVIKEKEIIEKPNSPLMQRFLEIRKEKELAKTKYTVVKPYTPIGSSGYGKSSSVYNSNVIVGNNNYSEYKDWWDDNYTNNYHIPFQEPESSKNKPKVGDVVYEAGDSVDEDEDFVNAIVDSKLPYGQVHYYDQFEINRIVGFIISARLEAQKLTNDNIADMAIVMEETMDKLFDDIPEYTAFISPYLDSYLYENIYAEANKETKQYSDDEVAKLAAYDIFLALSELPSNPYLDEVIEELKTNYIV